MPRKMPAVSPREPEDVAWFREMVAQTLNGKDRESSVALLKGLGRERESLPFIRRIYLFGFKPRSFHRMLMLDIKHNVVPRVPRMKFEVGKTDMQMFFPDKESWAEFCECLPLGFVDSAQVGFIEESRESLQSPWRIEENRTELFD